MAAVGGKATDTLTHLLRSLPSVRKDACIQALRAKDIAISLHFCAACSVCAAVDEDAEDILCLCCRANRG